MEKKLSASRIKTLQGCTWMYWANYHLKLPQESNTGAMKGTLCHLVFELLSNPRHKKHFKLITKAKSVLGSPQVTRLVNKHLKKLKMDSQPDFLDVSNMILVGLSHKFLGTKGYEMLKPEYEFNITNESPRYNITGFIDRIEVNHAKKKVLIYDYKSSKNKFSGDELDSNIQAMMYSLVSRRLFPDYECSVSFIFLRYAENPVQKVSFSKNTLDGFEYALERTNGVINSFSYKDAVSGFAYDLKQKEDTFSGPLMCGFCKKKGELKKDGNPKWSCAFKFPFSYYTALDAKGKFLGSAYKKNDLTKLPSDATIEQREYSGCPRFFSNRDLTSF